MPDNAILLAYYVASIAVLTPEVKQELLEMTDARQRIEAEIALLEEQIAEIERLRDPDANEPIETRQPDGSTLYATPLASDADALREYLREGRN